MWGESGAGAQVYLCNGVDRRSLIGLLGLSIFATPYFAVAQQAPPTGSRRIGFLMGAEFTSLVAAFKDELRKLGHIEGVNLTIETRFSRPNSADAVAQAAELTKMGLELIVAAALGQALAVRNADPSMPMVIGTCPGMVSNGFANSLERPGGNVTGMDELPPGVTARRLTLLKTAAPNVSRIALLSTTPGRGGHEAQLADAEQAAAVLGVTVKPYRVTSLADLERALAALLNDGMDGFLNFQGALSLVNRKLIVDFAVKHRLPPRPRNLWRRRFI
jgi:putative ABC transport system substrate-binding protein